MLEDSAVKTKAGQALKGTKFMTTTCLNRWRTVLALALALSPAFAQQGVIGIEFAADPAIGALLESDAVKGIRLRQVQPGSPAAAAGLRVGDLIVAINGQTVQANSLHPDQATRRAGASLDLIVLRDGLAMPVRLTVGFPPAGAPLPAALGGLAAGSKVEVQWNGRWFPATIKSVAGSGRWRISYDGYGSQWDEEVGPDRLRLPTVGAPVGSTRASTASTAASPASDTTLTWPALPPRARTPIAGAFMTVRTWMNGAVTIEAWFFTSNGRFSRSPSGGLTLAELAAKPGAGKEEGTYRIENGELIMDWADGRAPWRSPYEGHEKSLSIGGQFASRQSGFVRGWRLDGAYEGGASVGGGAVSSSNTLRFRLDGTFSRAGVVNVSSIGRTSEVSGGATSGASGTYEFDEFSLILRENGAESRVTVLMFGAVDQAGRPEQLFYGGGMLRRQ
ncbi:MAG: hypothetical protein RLZZ129_2691 [Verrucomicrobiota bacterium]|jgi:hypothetical protein